MTGKFFEDVCMWKQRTYRVNVPYFCIIQSKYKFEDFEILKGHLPFVASRDMTEGKRRLTYPIKEAQ